MADQTLVPHEVSHSRGFIQRISSFHISEPRAFRLIGILGVLLLIATLVPLIGISAYNHSYADDWHYGVWAHLKLVQTNDVGFAILEALDQVGKAWFEWQGTYSAIFLMGIEPSVFGEQYYVLAAPLVMATLIAGTLFFMHVVLVEMLGAHRGIWLGMSCAMLCVQLLLQPSPVEGIFWFNSAVYYTTYQGAALALLGCLLKICNPRSRTYPTRVMVFSVIFAVFVAGGNFVTALVTCEVMIAMLVIMFVRHNKRALDLVPASAMMIAGLILSLIAPGNEVRQQTQFPGAGSGVWGTIWGSSLAAFQYIQEWSTGLVLVLLIACVPLSIHVVTRAVALGWKFPVPGVVAVASIALFATSFTPTFWAQGSVGPGRVQNCRYDTLIVLLVINLLWCCGWVASHRRRAGAGSPRRPVMTSGHLLGTWALCALVAVCIVGAASADQTQGEKFTSISAARSLASGQATDYNNQVWNRLETIESSDATSLVVPYYTNVPHVLLMGDIRDNMNNYINFRLCQWYGKVSIIGYQAPAVPQTTQQSVAAQSSQEAAGGSK